MNEQEQKNKSDSFFKQQGEKAKEKIKANNKKKKLARIIAFVTAHISAILGALASTSIVVILIMLLSGFLETILNDVFKDIANSFRSAFVMQASATDETDSSNNTGGNSEGENTDTQKVKIKISDDRSYIFKSGYKKEDIDNIRSEIDATGKDSSHFSDYEMEVIGALMENGLDVNDYTEEELKCLPLFIKAEACTQYLDLRSNNKKFKNREYVPQKIADLDENEAPGVILVQRTNTNKQETTPLEYKPETDFNKLVESKSLDALDYFTIDDEGNLIIAKWEHKVVTVDGKYPDHLDDSEKESPEDEYIITTEPIAYSEYVKKYTMPFEFLVQLLLITDEPEFCMELVDQVLDSKIVINIQEEETITVTNKVNKYIINNKENKKLDYDIKVSTNENYWGSTGDSDNNSLLKYDYDLASKSDDEYKAFQEGKLNVTGEGDCTNYTRDWATVTVVTTYTSHSYTFEFTEVDNWFAHYIKKYGPTKQKTSATTDKTNKKGEYKQYEDSQTITDTSVIPSDKDVKTFINDFRKPFYESKLSQTKPTVTISSGTDSEGNYKQININNGTGINDAFGYIERAGFSVNVNGAKFHEESNEEGEGTGEYKLPSNISVTTIPYEAGGFNAKIPLIVYNFVLSNGTYVLQEREMIKYDITKLYIEKFEKIDTDTTIDTTVNEYLSGDPTTNTHFYAKDDKGNFEKFLLVYDKYPYTRDMVDSVSSWLFQMMEENDYTVDLVDIVKYLLYIYSGKDYGVTTLSLDELFGENMSMTSFESDIYGNSTEEKVWFTLKDLGFSDFAIAGVMGNIAGESGFKADAIESNGEGYAKSKGKKWTNEDIQIEFLIGEITDKGKAKNYTTYQMGGTHYGYTYGSWKDAKDVAEATKAFMAVFERPDMTVAHTDDRIAAAKNYYTKFARKRKIWWRIR